jgi:hypothetical protein
MKFPLTASLLAILNAKVYHRVTSVKSAATTVRGAVQQWSKKRL